MPETRYRVPEKESKQIFSSWKSFTSTLASYPRNDKCRNSLSSYMYVLPRFDKVLMLIGAYAGGIVTQCIYYSVLEARKASPYCPLSSCSQQGG